MYVICNPFKHKDCRKRQKRQCQTNQHTCSAAWSLEIQGVNLPLRPEKQAPSH